MRKAHADTPSSGLTLLRAPDNTIIKNFPATVSALDQLPHDSAYELLGRLRLPQVGDLNQKRLLLKVYVGIPFSRTLVPVPGCYR